MFYQVTADLLVFIHLIFIVFVIAGGLLVLKWPRLMLLHVPAVVWGVVVELNGWLCPLTPWENDLRVMAGQAGYTDGFIEHHIIPLIYPAQLTHDAQIIMGVTVLVINLCAYGYIVYRLFQKHRNS